MVFDVSKVSGVGDFFAGTVTLGEGVDKEEVTVYKAAKVDSADEANLPSLGSASPLERADEGARAFLVVRKNTLEVRCDSKLSRLLREKYESVMESRYFGRGGIEVVNSGQLAEDEICDLVRLSYRLSSQGPCPFHSACGKMESNHE